MFPIMVDYVKGWLDLFAVCFFAFAEMTVDWWYDAHFRCEYENVVNGRSLAK